MTRTATVVLWFLGSLVVGGAMASGSAAAQETASPPGDSLVVVTGEGVVRAAPNRAFLVITAESRARNPSDAQRANAEAMTRVYDRLRESGLGDDAVRTIGYDLQPQFDYEGGRQSLRGYVARNTIEVTIDTLEEVGDVIDRTVSAGATSIQSVRFDLKERESLEREALRLAVADARARAEAAAAGAGQRIDRIWRIEESGGRVAPRTLRLQAEAAAVATTPIVAGDVEVRAQVRLSATLR